MPWGQNSENRRHVGAGRALSTAMLKILSFVVSMLTVITGLGIVGPARKASNITPAIATRSG